MKNKKLYLCVLIITTLFFNSILYLCNQFFLFLFINGIFGVNLTAFICGLLPAIIFGVCGCYGIIENDKKLEDEKKY